MAKKSAHFVGEGVVVASQGAEETEVGILALFGFESDIGVDGGAIAQQLSCQRQSDAVLITGLDRQRLHQLETESCSPSQVVLGGGALHISGACHRGNVCLSDVEMVDVVLEEEGVGHPPSEERLIIGETDDVFLQDVVGWFETLVHLVPSVIARAVEGITQIGQMSLGKRVCEIGTPDGQGALVVTKGA